MNYLQTKIERLRASKQIITNTKELDELIPLMEDDLANWFATVPNPNRCGILDQYIGFIRVKARAQYEAEQRELLEEQEKSYRFQAYAEMGEEY